MPLYEFRCASCGASLEALRAVGDKRPEPCTTCGGTAEPVISAPAGHKGTWSRPHGRTCCGRQERCDKPPCGESGSCSHG